jgi:hypothetical protein
MASAIGAVHRVANRRAVAAACALLAASVLLAACTGPTPQDGSGRGAPSGSATAAVLRIDGMATVTVAAGLTAWKAPAATTKNAIEVPLERGSVLFLVDGPRTVDTTTWWQVQAETADPTRPFIWVRAGSTDKPAIAPLRLSCPAVAADGLVDAGAIRPLSPVRRVACFGGRDLRLRGTVSCSQGTAEMMVSGPSWIDASRFCDLDNALDLEGHAVWPASSAAAVTSVKAEVVGHFSDAESASCGLIPFGVSVSGPVGPPNPAAILICRELFVVTSLTPI